MDVKQALEVFTMVNGFVDNTMHELTEDKYCGYSCYQLSIEEVRAIHELIKFAKENVF